MMNIKLLLIQTSASEKEPSGHGCLKRFVDRCTSQSVAPQRGISSKDKVDHLQQVHQAENFSFAKLDSAWARSPHVLGMH